MTTKKIFTAVTLTLVTITASAQIGYDSQGRGFIGYPQPYPQWDARTFNIACKDSTGGLQIGDISIYTKLKDNYQAAYFTPIRGNYGLKMTSGGKIIIAPNEGTPNDLDKPLGYLVDYPQYPFSPQYKDAALIVKTMGSRAIHTVLQTGYGSGPTEGIRSDVTDKNDKSFAAYRTGSVSPYFYVKGDGEVYSFTGYTTASDRNLKEDITPVSSSSLNKIDSLQVVSFRYKGNGDSKRSAVKGNTNEITSQMQAEQNRKRIGLIAQDVEAVVPEVVRTMENGTKGIMYNDMIPLLINAIKELKSSVKELNNTVTDQQAQISELNEKIADIESGNKGNNNLKSYANNNNLSKLDGAELSQNRPNPFNNTTEIGYKVPQGASSAFIDIYNLSGNMVKKLPVAVGSGTVTISSAELPTGIYVYSLIIDGAKVASKSMAAQ